MPFDTAGVHRPVSDACGHTTCFQCFKSTMIKASGCTLCQREEEQEDELHSPTSDRNDDFVSTVHNGMGRTNIAPSSANTYEQRSDDGNQFQDAFFDEWSLDGQKTTTTTRKPSKFEVTFDSKDMDDQDFDMPENVSSMGDDEEDSDKATWISADVHDDGPEYRDKSFSHTQTMLERFHALFGLRKFRSNQQEAVNCALERRYHLFVLMPTGSLFSSMATISITHLTPLDTAVRHSDEDPFSPVCVV